MNSVQEIGRLTREIELKYTTSGKAVGNGTLAVQRQYTNANGERESDFINFVIWGKSAENMANMTAKGSMVGLEGSIQTRSYENNQGQKVFVTEVNVRDFTLIESKQQTEQRKQGVPNNQGNFKPQNNQGTFNKQPEQTGFNPEQMYGNSSAKKNSDSFADGQEIDISDDDLPF